MTEVMGKFVCSVSTKISAVTMLQMQCIFSLFLSNIMLKFEYVT